MNILVVFSEIPETTKIYLIETDNDNEVQLLESFNDQYVNSSDTPDYISQAIMNYFYDKEHRFKLKHKEIGILVEKEIESVVKTGFIL